MSVPKLYSEFHFHVTSGGMYMPQQQQQPQQQQMWAASGIQNGGMAPQNGMAMQGMNGSNMMPQQVCIPLLLYPRCYLDF